MANQETDTDGVMDLIVNQEEAINAEGTVFGSFTDDYWSDLSSDDEGAASPPIHPVAVTTPGAARPTCLRSVLRSFGISGRASLIYSLLRSGRGMKQNIGEGSWWDKMPLLLAAKMGDLQGVERLLHEGSDVDGPDTDGRTALHWAVVSHHINVAKLLLDKGACINLKQNDGFSCLDQAICVGDYNMVKLLVDHGADLLETDFEGWTPLHSAVCYEHPRIVRLLVDRGCPIDAITSKHETCLHIAVEGGKVGILKYLLSLPIPLELKSDQGCTALMDSVLRNRFEECVYLVDMGADVNTRSQYGLSPLYATTFRLNKDYVQLLLGAGVDISQEHWLFKPNESPTSEASCEQSENYKWLVEYAKAVPPLSFYCTTAIRKVLPVPKSTHAQELPLPEKLKDRIGMRQYIERADGFASGYGQCIASPQ